MFLGILKAVAKTYFQSELSVALVLRETESVKARKREHVVFAISVTKKTLPDTPTLVAQTKKGAEKPILKAVCNILFLLALNLCLLLCCIKFCV